MIDAALTLGRGLFVWLVLALMLSALAAFCYPLFARLLRPAAPDTRALLLLLYTLAVPVAASVILTLLMQPALSAALIPGHCHLGDCSAHPPQWTVSSGTGQLLVSLAGLAMFTAMALAHQQLRRGRHRLVALDQLTEAQGEGYRRVDSPQPMAWCAGLWRPRVYLSSGLLAKLGPDEGRAVLIHEQTHRLRRDNLRRLALHWASLLWPAPWRRRLLRDFHDATEQVCDRAAAEQLGSAGPVIRAIRAFGQRDRQPQGAFAAGPTAARLAALQADTPGKLALPAWLALSLLVTTPIALLTGPGHRLLEQAPL